MQRSLWPREQICRLSVCHGEVSTLPFTEWVISACKASPLKCLKVAPVTWCRRKTLLDGSRGFMSQQSIEILGSNQAIASQALSHLRCTQALCNTWGCSSCKRAWLFGLRRKIRQAIFCFKYTYSALVVQGCVKGLSSLTSTLLIIHFCTSLITSGWKSRKPSAGPNKLPTHQMKGGQTQNCMGQELACPGPSGWLLRNWQDQSLYMLQCCFDSAASHTILKRPWMW